MNKFAFLSSPRFWQLFLVGVSAWLTTYENTGNYMLAINAWIIAWLGGSVAVRTVDRIGDKKVEATRANYE